MYTDTSNDFSTNNNATHDNEEMEPVEFDELNLDQNMKSPSKLLNAGVYINLVIFVN